MEPILNIRKNRYLLTDKHEPTDKIMLSALMSAATADVRKRADDAHSAYFEELLETVKLQRQRWEKVLSVKSK